MIKMIKIKIVCFYFKVNKYNFWDLRLSSGNGKTEFNFQLKKKKSHGKNFLYIFSVIAKKIYYKWEFVGWLRLRL